MKKVLVLLALLFFVSQAFAFPQLLPVQGKLKGQSAGDVNKQLPMTFSFYSDASGGTAFWSETRNVDVNIIDADLNIGVFSILLGDSAWLDVNAHGDWNYLGIKIQSNSEMAPRIRLGAGAYSFISQKALSVDEAWFFAHDTNAGGGGTVTLDVNALERAYLFGLDWNSALQRKADLNANWYGKLDINRWFQKTADQNNFFVQLQNAYFYDSNTNTVCDGNTVLTGNGTCQSITDFYLSGAGGLPADMNQAYYSQLDANRVFERIADLNLFFYRKTDINAGWYGIVDVNRNFLSIIDANLWYYKKTDVNANFYGKLDVNNAFVPYIGATKDVNLGVRRFKAFGDSNFAVLGIIGRTFFSNDVNATGSIQAARFFGDGSGLTNLPSGLTWNDINAHIYGKLDVNTMFEDVFDLNLFYYKKTDINSHFYGIVDANKQFESIIDLNTFFYRKTDVNAHFAPKLNPTFLGVAKFPSGEEGNPSIAFTTNSGTGIWSTVGQTIEFSVDSVKYVAINNISGQEFSVTGSAKFSNDVWVADDLNVASDINGFRISAYKFFGDGAGLTGIVATGGGTATMDANVNEYNWLTTDLNKNYYGKLDVNQQFVPYIGAVRDVNLGIKGLVSGDANIGSVQYWEITQKDLGGGVMYPALIPHGDAGKYGLIEGGLTVSAPSGAADVVLGLYDSTFVNSWFFTHNIADGLFSLGKNGTTAPFFINSKTSIAGDFNATGDVNIAEDLNVAGSVKATAFFGNGAGLTGVTGTTNWADLNAHLVPYIGADFDVNLGGNGLTAWDGNYRTLEADYLFGDGSGLTGLAEAQDVNSHFVPYIGADFDVNLNFHDLNARSISANRFFGAGDWNRADINVGMLWLGGNWIGFNNQFGSTLYVGNDSPTSETLIFWTGVVGGINSTLIYQFGGGAMDKLYSMNDVNIDLGYDIRPFGELWLAEDANLSRAIKVNGAIFGNTSVKIGNDLNLLTKKVVSDVNISSGINKGVSIDADMNRICFPANSCEMFLDFNGTAFVFGS